MQEGVEVTDNQLKYIDRFSLVIFDFDGTLFMTEDYHKKAYKLTNSDYDAKCKKYIELVAEKCPSINSSGLRIYQHCIKNGIKTAIASSTKMQNIRAILACSPTKMRFDYINSGDSYIENNKPHPDIFLDTVDFFGVQKDSVLVIEDSALGFEAASRANLQYVDVNKFFT